MYIRRKLISAYLMCLPQYLKLLKSQLICFRISSVIRFSGFIILLFAQRGRYDKGIRNKQNSNSEMGALV